MAAVEAAAVVVEAQDKATQMAEPTEADVKGEVWAAEEQVGEQAEVLLQTVATKQLGLSRPQMDQLQKQVHQEAVLNVVAHML